MKQCAHSDQYSNFQTSIDNFALALSVVDELPFLLTMLDPGLFQELGFKYDEMVYSCMFDGAKCSKLR